MWTIRYRDCWISGYCASDVCTVQLPDYSYLRGFNRFRSLRSAKLAVRQRETRR